MTAAHGYTLECLLGSGGFGTVAMATHGQSRVAVKFGALHGNSTELEVNSKLKAWGASRTF